MCTLLLMGGQQEDTRHWVCLAPRGCQRLEPQAGVLDLLDQVEGLEAIHQVQELVLVALEALGAQEEAPGVQEEVLVQLGLLLISQL